MLNFLFSKKRNYLRYKLRLAWQHLERGEYNEAFQLCQEALEVTKGFAPIEVLYLGACALFGLGHIHQAEQWIEQYKRGFEQDSFYLYLRAYLALHRGQPEQALLNWTSILQIDPSQSFADQLIERIRRSEEQVMEELHIPEYYSRYLPPLPPSLLEGKETPKSWAKKQRSTLDLRGLFPILLFLSLGAGGAGVFFFFRSGAYEEWAVPELLSSILEFQEKDLELDLPKAPSRGTLLLPEGYKDNRPPYIYEERSALLKDYEEARRKILLGRVNQARFILGRIELSNVSFEIKERVLSLRASIPFLERSKFHDPLAMEDAAAKPYLYRGAQVLWGGKLRSLIPRTKGIELVLLAEGEGTGASAEGKELRVEYRTSSSQKKKLLSKLSAKDKIRVFGIFRGLEAGQFKVEARELLLREED